MMKSAFLILFGFIFFCNTALAQPTLGCDAAIIEALKTKYTRVTKNTLSDVSRELVCKDSGLKIDGNIPELGSTSFDAMKKACSSNSSQYFSEYAQSITTSYMPSESLSAIMAICGTKNLGLTLESSDSDGSMTLKARWDIQANDVPPALIKSFSFDKRRVNCNPIKFNKNVKIGAGGIIQVCTRLVDENLVFTLHTSQGDVSTVVRKPIKKAVYILTAYSADDQMDIEFNGVRIASTYINSAPQTINLAPVAGANIVTFRPRDNQRADGHACWSYGYEITADSVVVAKANNVCCVSGCPNQPSPQTYTFEY